MRTYRLAAAGSGLTAITLGILTLTGPTVPDEHWGTRGAVVNGLGLVTFVLLAIGVSLLPRLLHTASLGLIGVRVAQAGFVLMAIESGASQLHGGNVLGPVFMLGLLLSLAGLLVAGVDALRRPGSRWLALLPFLALLVAIGAGDRGGFVVLGVAWCAIARGTSTAQPSPIDRTAVRHV
jgi:hypothetical protein